MELSFSGEVVYWRGPSPWHFIDVPEGPSEQIADVAPLLTYGWGCIPVTAIVGTTQWTTSLFPKDGRYLVPVRSAVRSAAGLELGDTAEVTLVLDF